ncbi:hypothetical protein M1247_08355 [Mycobacterium sp. 21AC1]|uniref:hypothetical protein n=1 Tax=[Mycobacterium] appelbergii TaxID=2939269 RepID=UPI0029390665|nr:hypothetical protein [Mycobacterium sp. 21AC1]MDV3124920.1 hypothetical protein [Mycobacterium sp. 21AC1]
MSVDAPSGQDLALISRTEYLDTAVRIRRGICAALLLGAVPLFLILVLAGVAPLVIVFLIGGLVTSSFTLGLTGPLSGHRAAVRLGLVDGQILIGTESSEDDVRPLTELTDVALSADQSPDTFIAPAQKDLRVQGVRYLQLTFRDETTYYVALLETDPVAAQIMRRLQRAVPGKPRTHPEMKPAGRRADSPRTATSEAGKHRSEPSAGQAPDGPSASPAADVRLWEAARVVHRRVLSEYGTYELDPALYLRYPGVTDITRDHVMDFHTALEEAQALATDTYPDDAAFAGRYRATVDTLRRQWARCERDGKATGTSYLADDDRSDLDTAAKLYSHAQATDQPGEKTSYLRKVQQIVVDLDGRGRVHLPRPVVAAIESQVRLALEPGNASST